LLEVRVKCAGWVKLAIAGILTQVEIRTILGV
jgi:hypothetical protein